MRSHLFDISLGIPNSLAVKLVISVGLSLSLAGVLGAQQSDSPAIFVAHPWDPNSNAVLTPALISGDDPSPVNNIWTAIGPAPITNGQRPGGGPVSGRIAGIAAHPTDVNTIYIAAAGGGVWKTSDGGATWNPLTDSKSTLSMGAIAVAPNNPTVVYAGTGEANFSGDSSYGRGVLVSSDGGATFTLRTAGGAFDRKTISEIAVDPTNANIVYVAVAGGGANGVGGNNGVWKSTDGGTSWTNTTTAISTAQPFTSVRIDPNTPSTLYLAVGNIFGSSANGVYKTTDSGTTWTLLAAAPSGTAAGRIVVAVSKTNSQVVYVSASGTGSGNGSTAFGSLYKLERSDNGGTTWTDLTAGTPNYMGGQGWYDTTLIVDPTNSAIVYAGGAAGANSVVRSTNSGVNWTDISSAGGSGPHVDHHASAFDAGNNFLDGDDGGIYRYAAGPNTWTQLNGSTTFLNTIQFQGIGLHPSNINIALGGSQDNGTEMYSGSLSWTLVEGGDGGLVKFSHTNVTRVYHQSPVDSFGSANFFRRSDNGGTSWAGKTSGITDNTDTTQNFYSPFVVYPANGDHLLYGARHLWESTNAGDNWSALGAGFTSNIDSIGASSSDTNTIYVSAGGSTFVTINHGATWTPHNLPVAGIVNDIQVDPSNPQTAYAVVRQFTSGGNVFRTTNGGTTWTNISGNLPILPAWSFQLDAAENVYYVGNDDGVYVSSNGGTNWTRFGSGLPNAQVFQIELNTGLGVVGAATHGRGAWEILTSVATTLTYTGDTAADFHDPANLSAVLKVTTTGVPLSGATVTFTLGTQGCSGTTNASGIASCTIASLNQIPGPYTVMASFAGGTVGGVSYLPAFDSKAFTITKEETTLSYTGDTVIANGGAATLSGVLLEDGTTPIAGRTVTFTLGTDGSAQTCTGVTNATGKATCVISPVNQPLGPGTVSASFAGDAFYLPSSASATTTVFAFLTSGAFVLGDQSAAVGSTGQEFWGAQWSMLNSSSGGAEPPSFKGFAATLSSEPPKCGITWTTRPGNSSMPPATIPSYMGVLVTPSVTQAGSMVSGSASKIVVVKTDPGYGPDPGMPGTGTVVATFCK
jgi:photosystem II stability/assembly factor-like uncharacterized protein